MFTVCPKCTLTLALTANDLRIGQGYVRCGRCSNVFNALLKLTDMPGEGDATRPPIAQADPATTSQITRAIHSEGGRDSAPSARVGATPGAAAPKPAEPARDSSQAESQRPIAAAAASPARSAPRAPMSTAAPKPTVAASAAPASSPSSPRAATAAGAASPVSAPAARVAARPGAVGSLPTAASPATTPQPQVNTQQSAALRAALVARAAENVRAATAAGRPIVTPRPAAAATAAPRTAANPLASASAEVRVPVRSPVASSPVPAPPPKPSESPPRTVPRPTNPSPGRPEMSRQADIESDADALNQFDLVLKTLGVGVDESGAATAPPPSAEEAPLFDDPDSGVFENIVLEGERITQSAEPVSGAAIDELDEFTRRLGMRTGDSGVAPPATAPIRLPSARHAPARLRPDVRRALETTDLHGPQTAPSAQGISESHALVPVAVETDEGLGGTAIPDLDVPGLRASGMGQRWGWGAGCVGLALLLGFQAIIHWRDALAESPTWGAPLRGLYSALGLTVQPRWDLGAYEVRQEGAQTEGGQGQVIRVRFSLANHATRAQPLPLLRLTLLDRYGRQVAQRQLNPVDYWPPARPPQKWLASDERVDADVAVKDASADSASFELDVCLPDAAGAVHCAGDAAPATHNSL